MALSCAAQSNPCGRKKLNGSLWLFEAYFSEGGARDYYVTHSLLEHHYLSCRILDLLRTWHSLQQKVSSCFPCPGPIHIRHPAFRHSSQQKVNDQSKVSPEWPADDAHHPAFMAIVRLQVQFQDRTQRNAMAEEEVARRALARAQLISNQVSHKHPPTPPPPPPSLHGMCHNVEQTSMPGKHACAHVNLVAFTRASLGP